MKRLLLAILAMATLTASAQNFPDSIVVTLNTYTYRYRFLPYDSGYVTEDTLYSSFSSSITKNNTNYKLDGRVISASKIEAFLNELDRPDNTDNSLKKYGVDPDWITQHPAELLNLYSGYYDLKWNEKQREFITDKLTDTTYYIKELNDFLSNGSGYTMHHAYKDEYVIAIYKGGILLDKLTSRKFVWGYRMPWTNLNGDIIYNYGIEKMLNTLMLEKEAAKKLLTGNKLLRHLVNEIVDFHMQSLYKLSAYSFKKEIDELVPEFEVLSFEEVYGRGRYISDEKLAIKVVLKNYLMLDNVYLNFIASGKGKSIYSRDSIKADYKDVIIRIQSVGFLMDYIQANPGSKIDVYYFNNKGVNEYNIAGFNKDPESWGHHDKYVESLARYEKNNITPSFDLVKAIETSKRLDCGCNYRFDRSYAENAIFFELEDEAGNNSLWFLLPDNKVLLYIMEGDKVLGFDRANFGSDIGLQYPCVLFNLAGEMVDDR